jgi:hypothetical protein
VQSLECPFTTRPVIPSHQTRAGSCFFKLTRAHFFKIVSSHALYSVTTFLSLTSQDEQKPFFFLAVKNHIMSPYFKEKDLQWKPDQKHVLYANRVKVLEKYSPSRVW